MTYIIYVNTYIIYIYFTHPNYFVSTGIFVVACVWKTTCVSTPILMKNCINECKFYFAKDLLRADLEGIHILS